jgi:hypothetical protein
VICLLASKNFFLTKTRVTLFKRESSKDESWTHKPQILPMDHSDENLANVLTGAHSLRYPGEGVQPQPYGYSSSLAGRNAWIKASGSRDHKVHVRIWYDSHWNDLFHTFVFMPFLSTNGTDQVRRTLEESSVNIGDSVVECYNVECR